MSKQRRTALIIDDSAEDRELYRRYLSRDQDYSYTILEAESGEDGFELWQQNHADIILLDYQLPDFDGLEFLTKLLPQQPFLPVIVITGQGNEEIAVQTIKAGAQDYLFKGQISPQSLLFAVNKAIEAVTLRQQLQQRIDGEKLISRISRQIHQSFDLEEILQTTVAEVRAFLQTDRAIILRLETNGNGTVIAESVQAEWQTLLSSNIAESYLMANEWRSRSQIGHNIKDNPNFQENEIENYAQDWLAAISDVENSNIDPCYKELLTQFQVKAKLVIPIWQHKQVWGFLIAHNCAAPREWQLAEIDFLQELSVHVAIAIKQVQLYQETQQKLAERKIAEIELQKSQEKLQLALEASRMGTWNWDIQKGLVQWSENLESLFGLEAGSFDGSYEMFVSCLHPDDRDRVLAAIQHSVDTREDYDIEFRVVYPNGHIRWALSRGKVYYDENGKPVRMTGNDLDITERKKVEAALQESEERFRELAENINAVFWIREEPESRVSYVSPAYEFLWGFNPQELYENLQAWQNYIHPEDRDLIAQSFQEKAAKGEFDEEYRIILPDGNIRWIRDRCFPLKDEAETIYRFTGIAEDITAKKQTLETLQQSEELKNRILESSSDCIKLIDLEGKLVYMNAGGMCLMEIEQIEFFIGQKWACFWEEEKQPEIIEAIAKAKSGNVGKFQGYCPTAKGTLKFWDVVVAPVMNATGEVVQILATSRDITEQKQIEINLRESEERFRTLADNMSQFAWMTDASGWIFWYNQRWFEYTGTTLEQMQGWGWQALHHPDHLERVVKHFQHSLQIGEPWEDTFPLLGKDGKYRWFLSRAIPIRDQEGTIVRWFGTNTDIEALRQTEFSLRESEARYRTLVESIPQLVWTASAEGTILDVNQRWYDFTGLTLEQVQDSGWEVMIYPEDVSIMTQNWAKALESGIYYQAEGRMRRADGVYRWHLHQAVPQKNEQGQIIKWFGSATDIEAQKQLEIERDRVLELEQTARMEAERANRIKDEFLAILSHELRSPLNPILGWVQLLKTQKFDQARTAQGLETIERNAKLQTQLIDDLLDVAKILRGKLSLNASPLNLSLVIEAALDTVKTAAIAKSITLNSDLPNIGQVSADSTRLQQIIWNLLSNAIKFTPNGGRVKISLERVNKMAQITVSDTGKGINPHFLPHIFEYFRQEDASITRKHGGLGLGLAIVRHLVEAHGGTIAASSLGEGQGATFTVQLPLINVEPETESVNQFSENESDLSGIRILCVDDEPDTLELLGILLTHYGASVITLSSAAEVLPTIDSFQPDILVSDIGMPEVDGYSLLQKVRALPAEKGGQIPAIALTAFAGEIDQQKALRVGFQKHLAKPIEPNHLTQAVLELVRSENS